MPSTSSLDIAVFLAAVRAVRSTGHATAEQSYYPAVNALLAGVGARSRPVRLVLAHPSGIDGDFPDVALYERDSNVLVLPVEVKPAEADVDALLASTQARRYARSFGGGTVLVTNLRQWVVGRVDAAGSLVETGRVTLAASAVAMDGAVTAPTTALTDLTRLVDGACQVRGSLKAPREVARLLAWHGRQMRDSIVATRQAKELLSPISAALREGLHIDLPEPLLVPTVVQTLVYGLFAAWLESDDPGEFDWMETAYGLDVPVFADLLHAALRPALIREAQLTRHLNGVARVLMWVDRAGFSSAFDGDAIQYFYEPFLAEFDDELRGKLGVWYTPREIADYQVARADHHLKTDLGIADGIADPTVYLLDPACGTGTYIGAVIRHIHATNLANGEDPQVAADRARAAAVERILGFEILPAAFIICHLHLARLLHGLGAAPLGTERLRVYLTDALTGWDESGAPTGATLFPELEAELRDAAVVKHTEPVLVVLGNPPYEGYSSAETAEEKKMMLDWTEPLYRVWGLRKHRMNDLYVRFWRVSVERVAALTGRGVVTFITNRKWLAGRSYPTMREAVATSFQIVRVDDLHGAADDASHPGDQSVFSTAIAAGIKRGTAVVTAVRTGPVAPGASVDLTVRDHWGSAKDKRRALADSAADDVDTGHLPAGTSARQAWRLSSDVTGDDAPLDDYLPFYRSGVQPVRDEAVTDMSRAALVARMTDYFDASVDYGTLVARHPGFGVERARYDGPATRQRLLAGSRFRAERVVPVLFRPFDVRWMYWEPDAKLLNEARRELIPYWQNVPDQRSLVLPLTPRRAGALRPVVSGAVGYFAAAEPDARIFPLYKPASLLSGEAADELPLDQGQAQPPTTLVNPTWTTAARTVLGLTDDVAAGEAVFYALVAVMHSPAWLALQPVELGDFPDVPLPGDRAALLAAASTGRRIADLTDPSQPVSGVTTGRIEPAYAAVAVPDSTTGTAALDFGSYGRNAGQHDGTDLLWTPTRGWRNVPVDVWRYSTCGFQVLPKWLSYRVHTGLTAADREQVMLIARRVAALIALQADCDAAHTAAVAMPLQTATPVA